MTGFIREIHRTAFHLDLIDFRKFVVVQFCKKILIAQRRLIVLNGLDLYGVDRRQQKHNDKHKHCAEKNSHNLLLPISAYTKM